MNTKGYQERLKMSRYGNYTPIILMGLRINGCQLLHIKLAAVDAGLSIKQLGFSIERLTFNVKEYRDVLSEVSYLIKPSELNGQPNFTGRSKYTTFQKEQHMLALKHSNKRRR